MDFKLLSKNNIGVVSTLILVILLSQARVFDFLIDTSLGMFILIIFILGISYMNHNLGLVAVLFIIIMMNQNDFGYLEGFSMKGITKNVKKPTTTTTTTTSSSNDSSSSTKEVAEKEQAEMAARQAEMAAKQADAMAKKAMEQAKSSADKAAAAQKEQATAQALAQAKATEQAAQAAYTAAKKQAMAASMLAKVKAGAKSSTKESFVGGSEGFNMIDREGTMLKGKRSNEIPVLYNSRSQSDDDVEPMDSSMFKDSYSLF